MPSLRPDALTGAIQYHDAQVDGERVIGVRARDHRRGEEFDIRAKRVIAAAGVWTEEIQSMLGHDGPLKVRSSKGVHLVVPRDRITSETGVILRTDTSVLFITPWDDHWIIGTTDTDWSLDKAHPAATSADIDYLLETVNSVLVTPLTRDDVDGVYAGLRPLTSGDEEDETTELAREHVVATPVPGLTLVAGGKYTTYRIMAKDAVDEAVKDFESEVAESSTDTVPLAGAVGWEWLSERPQILTRSAGID